MNFFSNVLNSIPIVGHAKGIVHWTVGDTEGADQAMYQATRTSAVLGGGAVGCLAGPGGAVLGAMYAGFAADTLMSAAMDEPQGIVKGCENIGNDLAKGKNPTGSILSTGFQIGMDGVGGLGAGGVSSAASQISEKAVAKTMENVAKKAVASVGEKIIQNTANVTGEQVVKMVTKKVSEKAVKKAIEIAAIQAEIALVSTHVAMQAKKTQQEEKERRDREERDSRDRELRDREERDRHDRERRAREEKDRQDRDQRAREERDRQDGERWDREEKDRQDRERRAREEKDRQDRERRDRERMFRQERDRQDRDRRNREERERRTGFLTGSGPPQPPQGNVNNKGSGQAQVDFFAVFKDLLDSRDRELRDREKRVRHDEERKDREEKDRQDRECRDIEERDRQNRARRAREERDRQDRERRAREESDRQDRDRRNREERERRAGSATGSGPPQPPQAMRRPLLDLDLPKKGGFCHNRHAWQAGWRSQYGCYKGTENAAAHSLVRPLVASYDTHGKIWDGAILYVRFHTDG